MIIGTGVDIIEIDRIAQAIENKNRFTKRFFTAKEQEYCVSQAKPAIHYAARFAAKEAVVKAMGTGFKGFKWQSVEIIKKDSGQPLVKLKQKALKLADEKGITKIHLSLSHSRDSAIAYAIAVKE